MQLYLSEKTIRKMIRQELREVLEDQGIKTKKDDTQKVNQTSNIIKKIAAGATAVGAIVAAININSNLAKAEAERIDKIENEKMMMLSDKVDEKIQSLIEMGVTDETAQKIVVGLVLGVDKTEKDQDKIFGQKIKVLDELDIERVKLALSDKFITDMRSEGNQIITTIATGEGAFGVLPTNVDQSVAGMAVEVQKNLQNLDVQTGIMYVDTDVDKPKKLRTLTFDPLELNYWNDKVKDGSQIEQELKNLYGDLTIPAFMYETVAPTVASQEISSQLKENKKTRGKYV